MESKEQHLIRHYLILFTLFLFLAGCAHQIDTKTTLYDDWKPRLAAQKTWQAQGKLAFISPDERQSANLNWQQDDIVISSTASTLPIIGKGVVEQALKQRRHKPMLFIDIAVPRDIESQVGELDAAYLYSVDDLQAIVSENMAAREQAAEQAQLIISERVKEFEMWVRSLDSVDLIRHYRNDVQTIKSELVERAVSQLNTGKDAEKIILELANKLTNRLMHAPTRAIQDAAKKGEVAQLTQLKKMLGIDQE